MMDTLRRSFATLGKSFRRPPRQPRRKMAAIYEQSEGDCERPLKCMVVGDSAVGKSSMLVRYTFDYFVFNSHEMPTGPVFDSDTGHPVAVQVRGVDYNLILFDSIGQIEMETTRVACYPGTDVCLLCFSVVTPASFANIETVWLPEVRRHLVRTPLILVGMQTDLRDDLSVVQHLGKSREFPVNKEEGEKMAKRIKAKCYVECSALTMKGIEQVFDLAVLKALRKRRKLTKTPIKRMSKLFGRLHKRHMPIRQPSSSVS